MEFINATEYIKVNGLCKDIDEKCGIYAIIIDNKVVYVGQAQNLIKRATIHFDHILNTQVRHKYYLLNQAYRENRSIDCVLLDECERNKLNTQEKANFDKYRCANRKCPPLNFLFFKNLENYPYTKFIGKLNEYASYNKNEPGLTKTVQINLADKP